MKFVLLPFILMFCLLADSGFFNNYQSQAKVNPATFNSVDPVFDSLPNPPDTIPVLTITNSDYTLKMSELSINVEVLGNIACTTLEMNFENELDMILEAELNFPLGEGQTVTRFALEVNGKLREGVVVEKEKGQQVFEAVVRQNIDPGLLEKTKGNNFKARIYPIPAKGNKRIVLAYEQELINTQNGNLYLLPLQFEDNLDKFKIRVEVFKQKVEPVFDHNELESIRFSKWNESYIAEQEFVDYKANKQLGFVLPDTKNTFASFIENAAKPVDNDYFYINLKPEKLVQPKKLPAKICILYDVSSSAQKKDTLKELALLDKYFAHIKNFEARLITFSNEIHTDNKFAISNANWGKLKNELLNPGYDGATQLGSLDLTKIDCNEYILISDGISNFGNSEMITSNTPVMVISSSQSADFSYLNYIANSTGGQYINLKSTTIDQALEKLAVQPYQFISATYNENEITEVVPSKPAAFISNFSLAGQLKTEKAEITLNFGFGNNIQKSVKVKLNKKDILTENNMVSRIWAQKKISELDMLYKKNKDEIISLGKKYSIVTRSTSLIVLDRIEDYVRYEIVPPVELQKEYFEIVEDVEKVRNDFEQQHIEKVVELFYTRIKWWDSAFTKEKELVSNDRKKDNNDDEILDEEERVPTTESSVVSAGEESYESRDQVVMVENVEDSYGPTIEKRIEGENEINKRKSSIQLNAWDPQTPYMEVIKKANAEKQYQVYLEQKRVYASTPAFYLDIANYFAKVGKKKLALRVLSNIAEMEIENHELMRILAHRLEQMEYFDLAISVYEEVVKIRSEEPQSYRDLSLCLAAAGQYQKALDIIYEAIKKTWDGRFPEIEGIMAVEMNRIISKADKAISTDKIDKRLIKDMPVDVRIVLNWDTDNSDMDLWVTDPYEVKCFYSHPLTYTGGRMSRDFTGGYGPEEFLIKNALDGKYIIQANYYGSSSQRITGPTTIYLELYTNYGKKNEKKETITMQLASAKSVVDIGEMVFRN